MAVSLAAAAKVGAALYQNREEIAHKLVVAVVALIIALSLITSFISYLLAAPMDELEQYFTSPLARAALLLIRRQYSDIIAPGREGTFDTSYAGDYPFPVPVYRISCDYGWRIHPTLGGADNHTGLDIVTDWHGPVKAIDNGVVAAMEINQYYGRYVMLRHEREIVIGHEVDPETGERTELTDTEVFYSFYGHLASFGVTCVGQSIQQGDNIGTVGGDPNRDSYPGESTGAHLHFGIYRGLNPYRDHVNPHIYMTQSSRHQEED